MQKQIKEFFEFILLKCQSRFRQRFTHNTSFLVTIEKLKKINDDKSVYLLFKSVSVLTDLSKALYQIHQALLIETLSA